MQRLQNDLYERDGGFFFLLKPVSIKNITRITYYRDLESVQKIIWNLKLLFP